MGNRKPLLCPAQFLILDFQFNPVHLQLMDKGLCLFGGELLIGMQLLTESFLGLRAQRAVIRWCCHGVTPISSVAILSEAV